MGSSIKEKVLEKTESERVENKYRIFFAKFTGGNPKLENVIT